VVCFLHILILINLRMPRSRWTGRLCHLTVVLWTVCSQSGIGRLGPTRQPIRVQLCQSFVQLEFMAGYDDKCAKCKTFGTRVVPQELSRCNVVWQVVLLSLRQNN